jgi:D-alanine-D-alanine ligase
VDRATDLKSKKIGVLMGGLSGEREVSLRSGENCYRALVSLGYDAVRIDAMRDVSQRLLDEKVDVAFLALHGRFGEDGTIQGLLELMDIPYTGSGVLASALGMHKVCAKKVVRESGVPTPDFYQIGHATAAEEAELAIAGVGLPLMFKPVQEGSSLGVAKIKTPEELARHVAEGRDRFGEVFVEAFVEGVEVTVGVIEQPDGPLALPILELVPKNEFYDYEAKYTHGMTEFIMPARLAPDVYLRTQELAVVAFRAIGCRGFGRVDFMVAGGTPYFTEINTLPGMTDLSDLPAQAAAAGISYNELVETILLTAQPGRTGEAA